MGMLLKNWGRIYSTTRDCREVEIDLFFGELLKLNGHIGTEIVCHTGTLWITQEEDPRDYVLGARERFLVSSQGLILIESLPDGRQSDGLQGKRGWARFSLETGRGQDD